MAGNLLGPRGRYIYESDEPGKVYILQTDQDLAVAGLGTGAAAPEAYDPQNPPVGVEICPPPRRFTPRTVFVENAGGNRKSLIAFAASADLYASSQAQSVTIDTATFTTTGRKGEKLSF